MLGIKVYSSFAVYFDGCVVPGGHYLACRWFSLGVELGRDVVIRSVEQDKHFLEQLRWGGGEALHHCFCLWICAGNMSTEDAQVLCVNVRRR